MLTLRAAELQRNSFDPADNTIGCCWTTGAIVRRLSGADGPYDEELVVSANAVRLTRLNAGAPLLDAHDGSSVGKVLGSVVPGTARIERGQGLARIKLSSSLADQDAVAKIRDGIVRNVSVGYIRHRVEKIENAGGTPLWRVVDWEPIEISAVPVPADAGAQFRSSSCHHSSDTSIGMAAAARKRMQMRAAVSASSAAPRSSSSLTARDFMNRIGMRDALVTRLARAGGERVQVPDHARAFADMSIVEMAAASIGWTGRIYNGREIEDVLKRAFHSTSDFPAIFGDALNSRLLARYKQAMPTYRLFCAPYVATDFRTINVVRAGDFPTLERVMETGEIKAASFSESKEQLTIYPYGVRFNISRQMIVNDNLGAIDQMLGSASDGVLAWENTQAFASLISNSFTGPTLLTDSTVMFHSNHGNETSSGTAISIASVGAGRAQMMKQTSLDGRKLNLQPVTLLTGPDRLTEAEQLVATINPALIASAPTDWMKRLRPAGDANVTGDHWWLFADPMVAPCFVYGTLQGYDGPRLNVNNPFTMQGIEVKLEHDFGVAGVDYRGATHNEGAPPA